MRRVRGLRVDFKNSTRSVVSWQTTSCIREKHRVTMLVRNEAITLRAHQTQLGFWPGRSDLHQDADRLLTPSTPVGEVGTFALHRARGA